MSPTNGYEDRFYSVMGAGVPLNEPGDLAQWDLVQLGVEPGEKDAVAMFMMEGGMPEETAAACVKFCEKMGLLAEIKQVEGH